MEDIVKLKSDNDTMGSEGDNNVEVSEDRVGEDEEVLFEDLGNSDLEDVRSDEISSAVVKPVDKFDIQNAIGEKCMQFALD